MPIEPAARHDAHMVYDAVREVCVLYGGRSGQPAVLDDTWEFNGTKWTQITTGSPAGRSEFAMSMDEARNRAVVFGGTIDNIGNLEVDETWEFGNFASYQTFGTGCPGSGGLPSVSNPSPPRLGLDWTLAVSGLDDNSPAFMALGASNTNWQGLPLPLSLTSLGAPGCSIMVSHDITPIPLVVSGGQASLTVTMPGAGVLLGAQIYNQALSLDGAANQFGLVLSNAGLSTFGN